MGLNITLRQIRYFMSAAETGSISAAAQAVGISQSAVTEAIRALEIEMGGQLFHRHAKGVALTEAGQHFQRKARDVLDGIADIRRGALPGQGAEAARLRLGVSPLVSSCVVADLLARHQRLHPSVAVGVTEAARPGIESCLGAGELDAGVVIVNHLATQALERETLISCGWRLWIGGDHALAAKDSASLATIASERLIACCLDELDTLHDAIWQAAGLHPNIALRTVSVDAVRNLVSTGDYVALMPEILYGPWSRDGERVLARRVRDVLPPLDIGLVWARRMDLESPLHGFRHTARALAS